LAIPITILKNSQIKSTFAQYRDWWNSVSHPIGLQQISDRLCDDIPFTKFSIVKKDLRGENGEGSSGKRRKVQSEHVNLVPVHSAGSVEDVPTLTTSVDDETVVSGSVSQSCLTIGLQDVFKFLLAHESSWPDVVVTCPWSGIPLPSIDVKSAGLNGKLELSVEMAFALINFGNNLSRSPKVPD